MALLNFLTNGSYSVISNIFYNKQSRFIDLQVDIFSDSSKESLLVSVPYRIDGKILYGDVNGISNIPPESSSEGNCWAVTGEATGVWTGYEGFLMIYENESWSSRAVEDGHTVKNENDSKIYIKTSNNWVEHTSTIDSVTWDTYFSVDAISGSNNNLIKQIYEWLKTRPEFSNVTSDE